MTSTKIKGPVVHKDKLGRVIALDDFVAYPSSNSLIFGRVIKLNNKMVKVVKVPAGKFKDSGSNKYPHDMIKLDPKDMTFYLLTHDK
jgi:hypothetical protein